MGQISSNQYGLMLSAQPHHSFVETNEPGSWERSRNRQRHNVESRPGPHGGDVAQVYGQCLVPQLLWARPLPAKVNIFVQLIGRQDPVLRCARYPNDRSVVSDTFNDGETFSAKSLAKDREDLAFGKKSVLFAFHGSSNTDCGFFLNSQSAISQDFFSNNSLISVMNSATSSNSRYTDANRR